MADRDPRKNPRPGDKTATRRDGARDSYFTVIGRTSNVVEYQENGDNPIETPLMDWIQGSDGDEVIHVA